MLRASVFRIVCAGIFCVPAIAAAGEGLVFEKGYVGLETYYYPTEGATGQKHGNAALISEVEMHSVLNDRWSAKLTPFFRADAVDSNRNTFDLREAEFDYTNGSWSFAGGMRKLSWSVTESVNVVPHQVIDIINQRDMAGDPSGQEKLGTAMLTASYQGEETLVQGYILPWFRERRFPGVEAREHPLRGAVDLNGEVQYVSSAEEYRTAAAVRVEHTTGSANFAFIQYRGYAPQSLIMPNPLTGKAVSTYYLVDMSGVTLQATLGKWLFKTETAYFNTRLNPSRFTFIPNSYLATVSGLEYSFVRVIGESDISAITEWMYDSRGDGLGGSVFQNDLFLGARWVANDLNDTQILGGTIQDLEQRAGIVHLQYQRRVGKQYQLQVVLRSFSAEQRNALSALSDDSLVYVKVRYFF